MAASLNTRHGKGCVKPSSRCDGCTSQQQPPAPALHICCIQRTPWLACKAGSTRHSMSHQPLPGLILLSTECTRRGIDIFPLTHGAAELCCANVAQQVLMWPSLPGGLTHRTHLPPHFHSTLSPTSGFPSDMLAQSWEVLQPGGACWLAAHPKWSLGPTTRRPQHITAHSVDVGCQVDITSKEPSL